jgi:DNA-binding NarL/FixJ family response regulator
MYRGKPAISKGFSLKGADILLHLLDTTHMALAKVLVIEDDHFIRSTLSTLLSHKAFEVVGSVATAQEALAVQQKSNPHVVISDLDLGPGPNGIDIVTALRRVSPTIGVIILTSFSDPRLADPRNSPLPKGSLYFTKSQMHDISVLFTAIIQVRHLPLNDTRKTLTQEFRLTEVQIDVLRLVSEGLTTASIAEARGVSEKSIEAALKRIHTVLELPREKSLNPRVQLTRAFFELSGKSPSRS